MSDIDSLPLWWLMRGSGLVALVLLTATLALGVAARLRWKPASFSVAASRELHRNVAMLAVSFTLVHVATAVTNAHAGISLVDLVVPFLADVNAFWAGLGTIAFDLLLAISVSGFLRGRIPERAWHAVHATAYACAPVALLQGIGMGSDMGAWWAWTLVASVAFVLLGSCLVRWDSSPRQA